MFVVVTEACICAPEDRWINRGGLFKYLDSAIKYAKSGRWHGDILRIYYNNCAIAYCDEYGFEMCACDAIERFKYVEMFNNACEYDNEIPF